jgi:hypothetical protein
MRRHNPYKTPIVKAHPDVRIPEPKVSKLVVFLCRFLARPYIFLFFGATRVVCQGDNFLIDAFRRALDGKSRLIIAFRHPNGGEPQLLTWFFLFKLKALAAKKGVKFARRPHAVFIYGYEVVRWGGRLARFFMPRLGAMPVHHSRMDSRGMARIYKALIEGPYPLALAPEGQVSYTSGAIPRLENGVIRIGFNAAKQLAEKHTDCPLEILPLSIHLRFGSWGDFALKRLLKKIEKICGISPRNRGKLPFVKRLEQCRDHILEANEARYQLKGNCALPFQERLEHVINTALETAERMTGVRGNDDLFSRMYRVRQFCWDQIYIPGLENLESISAIERGIRDLKAGEAWHIGRHLELVDFCWYFRIPLPKEEDALHKKIEYTQNLWDFANRTMGGAFKDRVNIFHGKVIIQAAQTINLSERLPAFQNDKKAAIAEAMSALEKSYLHCIATVNNESP